MNNNKENRQSAESDFDIDTTREILNNPAYDIQNVVRVMGKKACDVIDRQRQAICDLKNQIIDLGAGKDFAELEIEKLEAKNIERGKSDFDVNAELESTEIFEQFKKHLEIYFATEEKSPTKDKHIEQIKIICDKLFVYIEMLQRLIRHYELPFSEPDQKV